MDSFDKGWFVLQTYSGYENKGKKIYYNVLETYNMLDNIRYALRFQHKPCTSWEKWKEKELKSRFPGYVLVEMVMTDEAWFVVQETHLT